MLFRSLPPHIWYSRNWNDSAYISDGVSSQDIFPHRDEILKPSVSWERLSDPFFLIDKLEMMILAILYSKDKDYLWQFKVTINLTGEP